MALLIASCRSYLCTMKRRQFLKSFAALGVAPMVSSMGGGALALGKVSAGAPAVNAQAYQWAEVIVRAHKTSSLAMLQRHLKVDAAAAKALQNQLIRNGVIGAQANAYGLYQAKNPLFDGAFPKSTDVVTKTLDLVRENLDVSESSDIIDDESATDWMMTEIPISALYNEADWTSQLVA